MLQFVLDGIAYWGGGSCQQSMMYKLERKLLRLVARHGL
jgi:hypothetical protein